MVVKIVSIYLSLEIVRLYEAVSTTILSTVKTLFLWVIGLLLTVIINDKDYKFESTNSTVIIIKFIGFILIVIGSLVYF
jgi:uncharacterized membrane protein YdcZ (DUF606 family)